MKIMKRRGGGVFLAAVLAMSAVMFAGTTWSAPMASALGPEVPLAQPQHGFVGKLAVSPEHGPMGTPITVTASGLPADQGFALTWRTVRGAWRAANGEYHGRTFTPIGYRIATLHTDSTGRATAHFTAPEDFGFAHDIMVQKGSRLLTQAAFSLDMQVSTWPKRGPVGTPIHVQVYGIGWRLLEGSWLLRYDNRYTGWISAVTTHGTASFTIPATGRVGDHLLEVIHGAFTFPYLNPQQSPEPNRPIFIRDFMVTAGPPVLPSPAQDQLQKTVRGLPPQGPLVASPAFSPVGRPTTVSGIGFPPGKSYDLHWTTVAGNRVGGNGWQQTSHVIARTKAGRSGKLVFHFTVPHDLGGAHALWVQDGAERKTGTYWITPQAFPLTTARGPVGTPLTVHVNGVGWTETANIYTVVYDNAYIGYACGFNSQGDVKIHMQATGAPGWHFIDLYPAIYKGKETHPNNFRIPELTYAKDHPGEDLPAFHFAFDVTKGTHPTASN